MSTHVCTVLVARPEPEATELEQVLIQAGYAVVKQPLLQIQFLEYAESDLADHLIFVSKNAVRGFRHWSQCEGKAIFAMGPGTAELIADQGFASIFPKNAAGRGEFLMLPELNHLEGQRFTLVCGQDGSAELLLKLQARGASVKRLFVYQAQRCVLSPAERQRFQQHYDAVIVTSLEALRYACDLGLPSENRVSILSENMLKYAREYGFKHFLQLNVASHAEILEKIKDMQ